MEPFDLFSLTECKQVYTIKIGAQVIGHTRPGDLFISNLKINDAESAGLVVDAALHDSRFVGREIWLLTDPANADHTQVAQDAGFQRLGAA
jgi:hypothetical protein